MLIKRAALLTAILFAVACDNGPSEPMVTPGLYRLVSVNGQAVPWTSPPSSGFLATIEHGDLYLRGNGTFGLGIGGNTGGQVSGNFRALNSTQIRLTVTGGLPSDTVTVTLAGDSASFLSTHRFVFKRVTTLQSINPGVFVLATINGRGGSPLVESDTVIDGNRFVARVHFDTLHFMDEVFYRRHRYQSHVTYTASGDSNFSSVEWTNFGAHDTISGTVVLRGYSRPFPAHPKGDTLSIVGNDLVRRSQLITGLREDRYVRQ